MGWAVNWANYIGWSGKPDIHWERRKKLGGAVAGWLGGSLRHPGYTTQLFGDSWNRVIFMIMLESEPTGACGNKEKIEIVWLLYPLYSLLQIFECILHVWLSRQCLRQTEILPLLERIKTWKSWACRPDQWVCRRLLVWSWTSSICFGIDTKIRIYTVTYFHGGSGIMVEIYAHTFIQRCA